MDEINGEIEKQIYENLLKSLNSKTSIEEIDAEIEYLTNTRFWNRWVEKFHRLTKEQRSDIIKKCIKKYASTEYINKELKLGYYPRENLFDLFCKYSEKYGTELGDEYYTNFVAMANMIDDEWVVQLLIAQGSAILVNHKDDFVKNISGYYEIRRR